MKTQLDSWHWKGHLSAYHHGFGVASQRILKESCKFGVTVGHMGTLAIHQCRDDIPQRGKREVDLSGFLQPLPRGSSFRLSFRTLEREQEAEAGVTTDPLIHLLPPKTTNYT